MTLPSAFAQTGATNDSSDAIAAARALFAVALQDEEGGHFDTALEKFRRVQAVKDTASIEYRIGTCHDGLGKPALAYGDYRTAVALGSSDPAMADVVGAARARLDVLSTHVARLVLVLPQARPRDTTVWVDGAPVDPDVTGEPLPVEPGAHVVVATARDAAPFRSEVTLPEGGAASLTITFASPAPAATSATPVQGGSHVAAWIAVAGGGVLLAASAVTWLLRHGDIASLQSACPGGICTSSSDEGALETTRNRALAEGPVAAGLGIAGFAALGVGAYLVLANQESRGAPRARAAWAPMAIPGGAAATLSGVF